MTPRFIAECKTCGVLASGGRETCGDAAEDHDRHHDVSVVRVATDGGVASRGGPGRVSDGDDKSQFHYTARTLIGSFDTRHEAVGALACYGDWEGDSVVPITENCYVRQRGTIFVGPDHIGDKHWSDRQKFPTTEGVTEVDCVQLVKKVNGNRGDIEESWWEVGCPVCRFTHKGHGPSEDARREAIDAMLECCGAEWVPPLDWIEDCDICGDSHRESGRCTSIDRREPFPDPDTHRYDCAECEWSGDGTEISPIGECPECGTTSVRAIEVAADGGLSVGIHPHGVSQDGVAHGCEESAADRVVLGPGDTCPFCGHEEPVADGGMVHEVDHDLPFTHTYLKHQRQIFPTLRRRDKFGDIGDIVAVRIGSSGNRERVGTAEIVAKETVALEALPNAFVCYDTGTGIGSADAPKRAYEVLNGFYREDIRLDESLTLYWLHWLERDDGVFEDE